LAATPTAIASELHWQKYTRTLYAASAFITVRNTCRVIEYALGRVGTLTFPSWNCIPNEL
jgi:hypothetical protein